MNERIRELAEQAWDSLIDEMDDVVSEDGRLNSDFLHAYTQRFAELIVRECARSVNDWYQNHDRIHTDPMSYVLAHFGVEE